MSHAQEEPPLHTSFIYTHRVVLDIFQTIIQFLSIILSSLREGMNRLMKVIISIYAAMTSQYISDLRPATKNMHIGYFFERRVMFIMNIPITFLQTMRFSRLNSLVSRIKSSLGSTNKDQWLREASFLHLPVRIELVGVSQFGFALVLLAFGIGLFLLICQNQINKVV